MAGAVAPGWASPPGLKFGSLGSVPAPVAAFHSVPRGAAKISGQNRVDVQRPPGVGSGGAGAPRNWPFGPEAAALGPRVVDTLDLLNNTLFSGNVLPLNGLSPSEVAYDGDHSGILVVDEGSNSVSVVSTVNWTIEASILVGNSPYGVLYDPGSGSIYVANSASDTLTVINDSTDRVVATVPVGSYPNNVACDGGCGQIFVVDTFESNVSVVNTTTNTVVATIPVGYFPWDVVYNNGTGDLYVTNLVSSNVSVISAATDRVLANFSSDLPGDVAYDSAHRELFVAEDGSYQCQHHQRHLLRHRRESLLPRRAERIGLRSRPGGCLSHPLVGGRALREQCLRDLGFHQRGHRDGGGGNRIRWRWRSPGHRTTCSSPPRGRTT